MGDQAASLTTGSRNKRGKQRPKMRQGAHQQQRMAKEQKLEDKVTRRAGEGKNSPHATQRFERMKRQDQRRASKSAPAGPTSPAAPTTPAAPPGQPPAGPPSGGGGTPPDMAAQLQPYTAPLPPIIKAYMDKLSAGQVNAPTFDQQFGAYKDIANREADRQGAAINESMGSMGARYSGATAAAQGRMRENTAQDLALQAANYQQQLEQNQFGEIQAAGGLAYGATEAGMNRYWQDFLRQTSPPPFVGGATDVAGGYGLPATVFN